MRKIVQHYRPNQHVTLYDSSLHAFCRGVIYMDPVDTNSFWAKISNKAYPIISKVFPTAHTEIPWYLIPTRSKYYPIVVKFAQSFLVVALIGLFVSYLPIL